ncbi:MAG: type 2 lanthipeptide synthetase LanM family protein, partial [Pseudomonadota bacterium]
LFAGPAEAALAALARPRRVAVDDTVFDALRTELAAQLAAVATPSLYPAFATRRSAGYESFVRALCTGGLADHCARYPVLARRLVWVVSQWRERTQQLFEALDADIEHLQTVFDLPNARVIGYAGRLSERHDNGRQVCRLDFAGGAQIIFKPRPGVLEVAWHQFLGGLQAAGCTTAPPGLRVVAGAGHGWFEFVAAGAAVDEAGIASFAERAGALCCLAWLLNASDLHSENVIAAAAGPVLIDAETLLQPRAPETAAGSAVGQARRQIADSCLASGLLHFTSEAADGEIIDHSGLLGVGADAMPTRTIAGWEGVGTDSLRPVQRKEHGPETGHVLKDRAGQRIDLAESLDEVVSGFRSMGSWLAANPDLLDRLLAAAATAQTRVVLRPSNLYAQIQQQLVSEPRLQTHGALPGMFADTLNRYLVADEQMPELWALSREERRQLERLDIPVARAPVGERSLLLGAAQVEGWFEQSGLEVARSRIEMLTEAGAVEHQLGLLRGAFSTEAAHCCGHARVLPVPEGDVHDRVDRLALALGESIVDAAVPGEDGSLTWLAPTWLRNQDRADRGAGYYLYNGAAGIALFLAALGRHRGEVRFGDAARRAMSPVFQLFSSDARSTLLTHEGVGLCHGLGSLVFAATHLARVTGDDDYLELAAVVSREISPERIGGDHRFDVEGGSAGALIALLALADRLPEAVTTEQLDALVAHLLEHQEGAQVGGAWPNEVGVLQTGLAHGAGGIAAALADYHLRHPRLDVRRAIGRALAYENSQFSKEAGNWLLLDHGPDGVPKTASMSSWCYGGPGIALTRLVIGRTLPDLPGLSGDLELALGVTRRAGAGAVDHVCCGAAGLADVLLEAGRVQDDPVDVNRAERLVGALAAQYFDGASGLLLHPDKAHNRILRPGFFRGVAGIGYVALRLLDADLPCLTAPGTPLPQKEALTC